eukprot:360728-Chlamydomonas_euryale.AAC.2
MTGRRLPAKWQAGACQLNGRQAHAGVRQPYTDGQSPERERDAETCCREISWRYLSIDIDLYRYRSLQISP